MKPTFDLHLDRRQFVVGLASVAALGVVGSLVGCTEPDTDGAATDGTDTTPTKDTSPITMVFLPDTSSADLSPSRDAFSEAIKKATGRDCKIMTTTDYNVTIEAVASGSAGMALLGAEGYVQANKKNASVQASFTNSDADGTLVGACYYSRICVLAENAAEYKSGSGYTLQPLKGKSFSFVSATSTSGFKVPSNKIATTFDLADKEVLLESGAFFSDVLLGGSHQGSAYNLLCGDAEAAAFDDIDVDMYFKLISGEANRPGAIYEVRADAEAPLDAVVGKQFIILDSTPVLNAPFCFNEDVIDATDRKAIVDAFCSTEMANDKRVFKDPKDETAKAIYTKSGEKTCFIEVADAWYNPIRELS